MPLILIGALLSVAVASVGLAAIFGLAWQQQRRANRSLAARLDADAQIEAATLQTMSAMRQAARAYLQRRDW